MAPKRKRFEIELITEEFDKVWMLLSVNTGPDGNSGFNAVSLAAKILEKTPNLIKEGVRHCHWLSEIFTMNLEIRDGEALGQVNPEITFWYAEEHGWIVHGQSELAYFMKHPESDDSFTLPKTRDVGDYSSRIQEAIAAMAKQQSKSQLLVWMELVH